MPFAQPALLGLGGALGVVAGGVAGWLVRAVTAGGARRRQLTNRICERVERMLLRGYRDETGLDVPAVSNQLKEQLAGRASAYGEALGTAFDAVIEDINARLDANRAEEEGIRREQAETIARLEPKIEEMKAMAERAAGIASFYKPSTSVSDTAFSLADDEDTDAVSA